ncbi:MAG: hypothetical protein QGF59_19035, partial [Pirellulaceae bacterium]|nr:hypothetical protein [Pirellulaceae bacterium]
AVVNGLIHVIGGRAGGTPGDGPPLATHEVYDPATDSWSTRAPLPIAVLDNYTTVAVGQNIYVMGGQSAGSGFLGVTQIYNTVTDTWNLGAPMPTPRSNALAGVLNGKIVVAGGVDSTFVNQDVTEIYDPVTDTWTTGPAKPTAASELAVNMTFVDSKLFAVGEGIFGAAGDTHEALLSTQVCVWIDTVDPNTPHLDLIDASDTGRNNTDDITSDNLPTFDITFDDTVDGNGNPFPHDVKVRIYDRPGDAGTNGEVLIYDSFAEFGTFINVGYLQRTLSSVLNNPVGVPFADGVHNLKLEAEDRAGNVSHDFLLDVQIDTAAPEKSFGDRDVANDGLHPDSDSGVAGPGNSATLVDRVTGDETPTFWGQAEADSIIRAYVNNSVGVLVQIGQTVAVPLDGNEDTDPNGEGGYWELTATISMNDPLLGFTPIDGLRNVFITAEDTAGNFIPITPPEVAAEMMLDIFVDTQGPQVTEVDITGSPAFNLFDVKPSQGPTPVVNALSISVQDLPNRVVNF